MNIKFEKNTNVSGVLTIEMQKADYEESVKQELKKIGKKAQMPGFRHGMHAGESRTSEPTAGQEPL